MADQLRYQSVGYTGDKLAKTPNIDKLAAESVNLNNAVVSMPVCSAYRSSLFTGKYVTSTGMVINELRLNPEHHPKCFAHCLNDENYTTSYVGKWHMYANQLGQHYDTKNSYIPPGKHRLGFDGFFAAYNFHHDYYGKTAYYHLDSPQKHYFKKGVYEPDGQTDLAIDQLQKLKNEENPFALFLSLGTPHDPWIAENVPQKYYDMFKDTQFPLPPNYRDEIDAPYGDDWSNMKKDPEKIQNLKQVYYAMAANLDMNLGRLMNAVKDAGLEENTIVVFTSDHGECFGAHGRMKKNIFYEEAARVPLLVRYPEKLAPGVSDVCISNVDIMQTILGLADIPSPEEAEGEDLSPCLETLDSTQRKRSDFAFLQNTGACAAWENGHEWRAVRTKEYTYAVYKVDGKEFLFNNISDPFQMENLINGSEYQDIKKNLLSKMKSKMSDLNDTFEESLYYKKHWISDDRKVVKTAIRNNFYWK